MTDEEIIVTKVLQDLHNDPAIDHIFFTTFKRRLQKELGFDFNDLDLFQLFVKSLEQFCVGAIEISPEKYLKLIGKFPTAGFICGIDIKLATISVTPINPNDYVTKVFFSHISDLIMFRLLME